jgi:hypothetical protein
MAEYSTAPEGFVRVRASSHTEKHLFTAICAETRTNPYGAVLYEGGDYICEAHVIREQRTKATRSPDELSTNDPSPVNSVGVNHHIKRNGFMPQTLLAPGNCWEFVLGGDIYALMRQEMHVHCGRPMKRLGT